MSEPLRVGMIGYRFMGRAHANALARLPMFFPETPTVERDLLVGRDEAALAEAAERLGFARTVTDWREAVSTVDVLYNLAPNHLHPEPSIAALEADVHVLCEKPLAHTLEAAETMRAAAQASSATGAIGFNYRYVPAIRYARQLIEAGHLGTIRHVRARYLQDWLVDPSEPWSWRNDAETAGTGALGDLGSHMIDLVRYLVGDRTGGFVAVSGHLATFVDERPVEGSDETRHVTVDDAFTAQARFESGAMGILEAGRTSTGRKNALTLEIDGTQGAVRFDLERLNELEVRTDHGRGFETVLVTEEEDPFIEPWWPPGHTIGWEHTFVHEHQAFLTAAAAGEDYAPSFADGYAVQSIMAAIQRAAEAGEWRDTGEGVSAS